VIEPAIVTFLCHILSTLEGFVLRFQELESATEKISLRYCQRAVVNGVILSLICYG